MDGVFRRTVRGTHRYGCGIHGVTGLPGATTVMGAMAAPGLEYWKRDQLLRLVMEEIDTLPARLQGKGGLERVLKDFHTAGRSAGVEARDIGSAVHAFVEADLKGQQPEVTPDIERHVEQYRKWWHDHAPSVRASEFMVVSETHRYGATGDLAFVMDGEFWGVDIKTGKVLAETGMQLAAIRFADHAGVQGDPREYKVPQTTRHGVLVVHADECELVPYHISRDREFDFFLACRKLYDFESRKDEVFAA